MKLEQLRQVNQAAEQLMHLRQMLHADNVEVFIDGRRQGMLLVNPSRPVAHHAFRAVVIAAIAEVEADLEKLGVTIS